MRTYTIGELAHEFGVTPRALRFYEDKDLLSPMRNGMNRVYSHKDRVRLQLILHGKSIGFSLSEIREMLEVYRMEGRDAQLKVSRSKFSKQIKKLEAQRHDIDAAITFLEDSCIWIDQKLSAPNGEAQIEAPEIRVPLRGSVPVE